MAFNHATRMAASCVASFAIKASAGSQRRLHHHISGLFAAVNRPSRILFQGSVPLFPCSYSSKSESDASLLRAIEVEIQSAAESQDADKANEVPQGFPFEIEDHPGQKTITLNRDYQGEVITVEVHKPRRDNEEDYYEDEGGFGNEDDSKDEGRGNKSSVPLVVRVSKKSGPFLEFGCTANADDGIAIDSLALKDHEISEDQIAYQGPDFGNLDWNMQRAFHKYLELRGIKPSTTNFLHGYMLHKDGKEYTAWLKNLQEFVQA